MGKFWPGVKICNGSWQLRINQACLEVVSYLKNDSEIYYQTTECFKCPPLFLGHVLGNSSQFFVIDTSYPLTIQAQQNNCSVTQRFDDFGLYSWNLQPLQCSSPTVLETPERFWSNIVALAAITFIIFLVCILTHWLKNRNVFAWLTRRRAQFQQFFHEVPAAASSSEERVRRLTRVTSIDVFRGIAITLMVFVNYGGGQYSLFKHVPWNGLHVADVVFPFFIWIMGMSTVISLRSQLRASFERKGIFIKILQRSVFLILLGVALNSGKRRDALRIPGVLQRIGLTFFIVASIELLFNKPQRNQQYGPWNCCIEMVDATLQWGIGFMFLSAHILITFLMPVPGCPTGYLGPGGLSDMTQHENCTGGAAGYIDRLIFTPQHIYQTPTSSIIYHSNTPYDPEGLLGLLNSVVMAFFGAHCGRIFICYERSRTRILRCLLWGAITGILAGVLCSWGINDGVIPINKNLWSTSYVLATTSIAFFLLVFVYFIVDVLKIWDGAPFKYAGMNSILIYFGHEIMNKQLPWRWSPFTSTHIEILIMDISATLFWLLIAFLLHRSNVFIKL